MELRCAKMPGSNVMEEPMTIFFRTLAMGRALRSGASCRVALGPLALLIAGGNVQPSGDGPPPLARTSLEPETASGPEASDRPRPAARRAAEAKQARQARKPPLPSGPRAVKAAPLPKADKVLAIFHSGNVEGEIDPCG